MKFQILHADARALPLPDRSVHTCVTSPPYWGLRDYGAEGQLGLEATPEQYVANMVEVFREVRRVLRDDGTLWLNLGDSYANVGKWGGVSGGKHVEELHGETGIDRRRREYGELKGKDLVGIPWMVAFALRADGWYLRSDIIWAKPNPMPESVTDRCTKSHEYIFLLSKSPVYFYDAEAIKEKGTAEKYGRPHQPKGSFNGKHGGVAFRAVVETRNRRSVWTVSTHSYKGAHFATYPPKLILPCILAGTSEKGCCSACGAGWVRRVEKVRRATRPGESTKVEGKNSHFHISRDPAHSTEFEGKERMDGLVTGNRDPQRHVTETQTTGWAPGCECNAGDPVPCTVLDPFNGAGTTGLVAVTRGRNYIGTDVNPTYIEMAKARLVAEFPLSAFAGVTE